MSLRFNYILLFYITLSVVPYVWSIKCWNCRSTYDSRCEDPFDNSTLPITDCNQVMGPAHLPESRPAVCRKIRQKVNGEWTYIRDCAYLEDGIQGDERFCTMRTGTNNVFIEYCTCNSKDGCNSSSTIIPLPLLVILAGLTCWFKILS